MKRQPRLKWPDLPERIPNLPIAMSSPDLESLRRSFAFETATIKVPRSVPEQFRSHAGQIMRLNTSAKRSVVALTSAEAALFGVPVDDGLLAPGELPKGPDDRRLIAVANVFHEDQFWIGLIDPRGVQHVIMEQEVFIEFEPTDQPLAAHGQLRFLMQPGAGIQLYPQEDGQATYTGAPIDDFIMSAEATGPDIEGFPGYDLLGGTKGWFNQTLRLVSTGEKSSQMLERDHQVQQFLLRLQGEEPRNVLIEAIRRSHEMGLTTPYNTLAIGGTQCVFEAFNILDRAVLKRRKPTLRLWLSRLMDRAPIFVDTYLEARDLRYDAPELNDFPTLNAELAMSETDRAALRTRLATLNPVATPPLSRG